MVDKNLEEHLADHYRARLLSESVASRLKQASRESQRSGQSRSAPRSTRMNVRTKALVACMFALVLLTVGSLRQVGRLEVEITDLRGRAPVPANPNPDAGETRLDSTDQPNLVAMFVYADYCPRSPSVKPIYGELEKKYGDKDVFFIRLEISNQRTRHQKSLFCKVLDIEWLFRSGTRAEVSGLITLVDRSSQTVLADLYDRDDLEHFESALDDALRRARE